MPSGHGVNDFVMTFPNGIIRSTCKKHDKGEGQKTILKYMWHHFLDNP